MTARRKPLLVRVSELNAQRDRLRQRIAERKRSRRGYRDLEYRLGGLTLKQLKVEEKLPQQKD